MVTYKEDILWVLWMGVLFAAYYVTAKFGLQFYAVSGFAALIWPPTGIAIAGVFLGGYRMWPAIAFAAFFVNVDVGAPPLLALAIAFGNTLEALVATYVLRNYVELDPRLARLDDGLGFVLVALTATTVSATIGVGSLLVGGVVPDLAMARETWIAWWVGDLLGALVITPLILLVTIPMPKRTTLELLESFATLGILTFVSIMLFWSTEFPHLYILLLPLAWIALRTDQRSVTFSLFIISTIGISGTLAGFGPYSGLAMLDSIFQLQLFIGIISAVFIVFSTIIEERRDATQTLKHYVAVLEGDLERSQLEDRAKSEFLAILGHELRNPLAPIVSSLEYLRLNETNTSRMETIVLAENQASVMRRLLDDLLDITRISQNAFVLKLERVVLQNVLKNAMAGASTMMRKHDHTSHLELPDDPLILNADPARLNQIFSNIIYNAIKYTDPGGTINISAERRGASAIIMFADSGVGIPQESLGRIFEPFVSINPRSKKRSGLGIGLALTKRLVEMHGGTVAVESKGRGKGSTFTLTFPLLSRVVSAPVPQPLPFDPAPPRRMRILLVDDNEDAAEGLGKLLAHQGHEVHIAHSGERALVDIPVLEPDVVLLDIELPDTDGYEVARRLTSQTNNAPVLIAITGHGMDADKQRAYEAGFQYHLTKPVTLKDLGDVLTNIPKVI